MAKYKVNYKEIEDIEGCVLTEAVARYLSVTEYPSVDTIAAILGIEKEEENKH